MCLWVSAQNTPQIIYYIILKLYENSYFEWWQIHSFCACIFKSKWAPSPHPIFQNRSVLSPIKSKQNIPHYSWINNYFCSSNKKTFLNAAFKCSCMKINILLFQNMIVCESKIQLDTQLPSLNVCLAQIVKYILLLNNEKFYIQVKVILS